jgi:hypothetical protein
MGVTPGSTTVDKNLELTGNVCPVRWGNRDYNVSPFVFRNYFKDIVLRMFLLKTFSCIVTTAATFA